MRLPPIARVFFAIELPAATKVAVSQFIEGLKKKAKTHTILWTKPENLHITLQFLAEVQSADLPRLLEEVRAALTQKATPEMLTLGQIQLFPAGGNPRVIVLDVHPGALLTQLSQAVGEGIVQARYEIDARPFRGHLTLGRMTHPHLLDLKFLFDVPVPSFEPIPMREIALFWSRPALQGSEYTVIERLALPA
jgi:2'-5' RNA ligase